MSIHPEPTIKKAIALFDGQNLFYAAKNLYGYRYPNYDPVKLAHGIATQENWKLEEICFYTGVPEARESRSRAEFWNNKLRHLKRQDVNIFRGKVKYHYNNVPLSDGTTERVRFGYEKGVDVQIAIDAITKTRQHNYDVVLIFSQDNDLSGVAQAIRTLAYEQQRWIKVASAFPVLTHQQQDRKRGIDRTDWKAFDKQFYDSCIDTRNYLSRS